MKTKFISSLATGLALVAGFATTAQAVPLASLGTGAVTFTIDVLDMGTTTYPTTPVAPTPICTTVAGCNTASGTSIGDNYNPGEDTWGVFKINQIQVGATTWTSGDGGIFLRGMFWNGFDQNVVFDPITQKYTATGLANSMKIAIYAYGYDFNTNPFVVDPSDRTGTSSFAHGAIDFTDNALYTYLTATFNTFQSTFACADVACESVDAASNGFLSVDGGVAKGNFDTNRLNGQTSDLFFSGSPGCSTDPDTGLRTCNNWTTNGNFSARGTYIPEPGSLALVGLALAGLGAVRRRRNK